MELKDVIHFYLGCEFAVTPKYNEGTLIDRMTGYGIDTKTIYDSNGNNHDLETVKLLLRPLSSMTEEEAENFGMMYEQGKYHSDVLEFDTRIGASTCFIGTDSAAERIFNLIKAGFDLFGLIESGQAIDSTKL